MQTVHMEQLPHPAVDLILLLEIRSKVHQHSNRFARHVPPAHLQVQSVLLLCMLYPSAESSLAQQLPVSNKIRAGLLLPAIRTYEDDMVWKFLL